MINNKILLVGCGNMGEALLSGWLAQGIDYANLRAIDPNNWANINQKYQIATYSSLSELDHRWIDSNTVIVLAVKPQIITLILPEYAKFSDNLFISIIAGKTTTFFKDILGSNTQIVRAMPNIAAHIRQSTSALFAADSIPENYKHIANWLFAAIGSTYWLTQENELNMATAITGSGPAYLFLLAEQLTNSAAQLGLDRELADKIVRDMLIGSASLLASSHNTHSDLRKQVTSPGGTTEAALNILTPEFGFLIHQAIQAATTRANELSL